MHLPRPDQSAAEAPEVATDATGEDSSVPVGPVADLDSQGFIANKELLKENSSIRLYTKSSLRSMVFSKEWKSNNSCRPGILPALNSRDGYPT